MRDKQYKSYRILKLIKKIRINILIKRNKTFNKKKKNELRNNSKETRIKIMILNIYETRETTVYKELSRRSIS